MDNRALHDTFAAFGPILSCVVATDDKGQSKGFAFVQFEQDESARTAIEKVNGMLLAGKQVIRTTRYAFASLWCHASPALTPALHLSSYLLLSFPPSAAPPPPPDLFNPSLRFSPPLRLA